MSKLEFKPSDFEYFEHYSSRMQASEQANKRLVEMLKDAVVVYGDIKEDGFANYWSDSVLAKENGKKKALLINIEEIKKECKHIPAFAFAMPNKCRECGVTLYMHWSDKSTGETQGTFK